MNTFFKKLSFLLVFTGLTALAQNTEIQYLSGTGYQDTKVWEFPMAVKVASGQPSMYHQFGSRKVSEPINTASVFTENRFPKVLLTR